MADETHIVRMHNICKEYPGVKALQNVDFKVKSGEIRALIGENGAGKSTLIKILTGAETLIHGEIFIDGKKIEKMTPIISEQLGITAVYQNLVLANHLTVAENVMMGRMPTVFGFLSKKKLVEETKRILDEIGYQDFIDPLDKVGDLTASKQGMVAIVRAISRDAKIIIFDEPTAILADREVDELFRVIRLLKEKKLAVIYISHRLEEIFKLCDTVTVLKDGKYVDERMVKKTNENELISMMVGRDLMTGIYDKTRQIGEEVLQINNLTNKKIDNCSFNLKKGEIIGLYGLVGSGRTELSRALFGADPVEKGEIRIRGKTVKSLNPCRSIDYGMGLIPEDRRRHGLAQLLSVKHNINLPIYRKTSRIGMINIKKEKEICNKYIKALTIRTPTVNQRVSNLSGGNQQKVVVAKWLASDSHIFIMDEPTNGIDVGAKEEIYNLINKLAKEGSGIIFISSYMPELIAICDRILVMRNKKIVKNIEREDFDEHKILSIAIKEI